MPPVHNPASPQPVRKWWVMLGIGLGAFMFTLDTSIVYIAGPSLVAGLKTSFTVLQGVQLSYLLVLTTLVLSTAALGDILGKKRLYVSGLIVFTVGSLLSGLAFSIEWLIAFRVLQGLGAVFMTGLETAIIAEVFPESQRGQALGILGAVVAAGVGFGPMIGGVLVALMNWRSIFLVNVPLGLVAFYIVQRFVPHHPRQRSRKSFDWLGSVLIAAALACFALGMTLGQHQTFHNPDVLILLAIAALLFGAFLWVETQLAHPMLDLAIFRNFSFSLGLVASTTVFIVIAGTFFLIPFFLENLLGYSTLKAGLFLAVGALAGGVAAPIAGSFSDRIGSRPISLLGLGLMALGCLSFSQLGIQTTEIGYMVRAMIFGAGLGTFQSPNNSSIMGAALRSHLNMASALLSLSRTLGQIIGVTLLGAIFHGLVRSTAHLPPGSNVTQASKASLATGFQGSFIASALILVAGMAALILASRLQSHSISPSSQSK